MTAESLFVILNPCVPHAAKAVYWVDSGKFTGSAHQLFYQRIKGMGL
jgi:hypothetical protein